ncbi:hypothetical protein [uncultured Anaerococcus sp.]|uniref:hypothetical protein n=1 Tax=uncultured Anaerococcus sp. TaxID=293428 RepID=UPI0025FD5D63|nr:hypothetical protein [uncultured Anaerococcus sp.]
METLTKIARYLLSSIILFALATSLISLSVWLDMRIHARHIVYASFTIMLIFIISRDFKTIKPILIGEIIMVLVFIFGKFPRVSYELRDAFYLPIGIEDFKLSLIIIIIVTSLLVYYDYYKKSKSLEKIKAK